MSMSYEGRRIVVDGLLIDAHAFEYGEEPEAFARAYHAEELPSYVGCLVAENAKLRELVMDYDKMLAITTHEDADLTLMPSVLLSLRSRAYGLGIEVDA